MEVSTQRRAAGLKDKIPDISKTLETVQFLNMRKVRQVFVICDTNTVLLTRGFTAAGCRTHRDTLRAE